MLHFLTKICLEGFLLFCFIFNVERGGDPWFLKTPQPTGPPGLQFTLVKTGGSFKSKETLFEALKAEANFVTILVRIFGFLIGWLAFCLLAGPLEIVTDCIPFIGPCMC